VKRKLAPSLILILAIILFQCSNDRTSNNQTTGNTDSLNLKTDSVSKKPQVFNLKPEIRLGMEVFYRRSGGGGLTQFGNLKNRDTIHFGKGGTQRVYQVTHSATHTDALQAVAITLYAKGKVVKNSNVNFNNRNQNGKPVYTFYDYGSPEPSIDLVQITFDFLDRKSNEVNHFTIFMLLDRELNWE
jgi:hypothetical protein